jgi:phosphatidate cytidylyltransferase
MSNLVLRAITGFLFVTAIVCSIWFNVYVAIGVFTLFFVAGIFEYVNLFKEHDQINIDKVSFLALNIVLYVLLVLCLFFKLNFAFLFLFFPILFLFMIVELWRKKDYALYNIAIGVFGFIYLLLPFSLILALLFMSSHTFPVLIGMFLLIWTNDTFAYLSGRFFGKTKLIERISPKKTWEGTIGGVLFTFLVAFLIGQMNEAENLYFWLIAALFVAPSAILGDLLESLMKRNLKIKDSGTILPGHGGILDRFDATFFTVPFFFCWVIFYDLLF